jgi:hypothetical protein
MKHLAQLFAASVLTLALAFSTFAGHAECPGIVDPPPPPATSDISTPVTEAVLIVIVNVLLLS